MAELPLMTRPSTGNRSPHETSTTAPGGTSAAGTFPGVVTLHEARCRRRKRAQQIARAGGAPVMRALQVAPHEQQERQRAQCVEVHIPVARKVFETLPR